ncbi:hypothetical protein PISL3812_06871 [Talaromyces islandicus]|uniref:Uncharacterized protein n=1 Tax=Talaromyces islandicus TaxID=28573 RepID=A0A0U1M372_TALIS|nr:hypothetical protein PISL3812_06871 [Talaromyces islandicus]
MDRVSEAQPDERRRSGMRYKRRPNQPRARMGEMGLFPLSDEDSDSWDAWCGAVLVLCCVVMVSAKPWTGGLRLGPRQQQAEGYENGGDGHRMTTINPMDETEIGSYGPMQQRAAKRAAVRAGEQDY